MALDLVDVLKMSDGHAGSQLPTFLKRIEAWQRFMQRDRDSLLSLEAQVGLFGELLVLREICSNTGSPVEAINCWQGPAGGIQDFHLADGAIEVKNTISATSFPAKIHGVAQLDDAVRQPHYLAGDHMGIVITKFETLTPKSRMGNRNGKTEWTSCLLMRCSSP